MSVQPVIGHPTASPWSLPGHTLAPEAARPASRENDLFERTAWLYAFLRERVFRDDTDLIHSALWSSGEPMPGTILLEVGCGPGIYARRLAARNPGLRTVGIDRSPGLLERARERAARDSTLNCRFEEGDALALAWPDESADAVVASRLFTVVDGRRALSEMHRVLRPGGRCFIAEPETLLDTLGPMAALRVAGWLAAPADDGAGQQAPPAWPRPLAPGQFADLVCSRPWVQQLVTHERGYHYAVCQKPLQGWA